MFLLIVLVFGELPIAGGWACPLCGWGYGVQPSVALLALGLMLAAALVKPTRGTLPVRILVAVCLVYPLFRVGLTRWFS